jgi:invasion protein IalB
MRLVQTLPALVAALLLAHPALAQETAPATDTGTAEVPPAAPASPDDLSLGTPADEGPGSVYIEATHGDWQQRCIRTEDGSNPCELFQLLRDGENPVAEFSIVALPPGGQAAAGATIVVPLETLLTQQLTLQIDGGEAKKYPFFWCDPIGCVARLGFTEAEVNQLKRGSKATLSIVSIANPKTPVTAVASLTGFTAGYDAVAKTIPAGATAAPAP